jgi:2-dehydro-3-deoxygalactonokinase
VSALECRLVALDWGTTSLRAHRLAGGGVAIETRQLPLGVSAIARAAAGPYGDAPEDASAAFQRAFDQACGDWVRQQPDTPVIACGMVGSAQGWREVPYVDVPASAASIAPALTALAVGGATLHIVPGLIERGRLPNLMRGEETQIVGAIAEMASTVERTLVVLPGTHSKWAQVRGHEIVHFDTFMTGEVYDALAAHTLLARTLRRPQSWDVEAFDRGVSVARSPEGRAGMLSTIFSTRVLAVRRELSGEAQADYLSGLLIGHEVRGMQELDPEALDGAGRILLAGSDPLCRRYARVLAAFGRPDVSVSLHATERGLWCLAGAAGLLDGRGDAAVSARARATSARIIDSSARAAGVDDQSAPGARVEQGAAPARGSLAGAPGARVEQEAAPARGSLAGAPGARVEQEAAPARGSLAAALSRCGLLAILRGLSPHEAAAVGGALYAAGLRAIEVPLNSPDPLASIRVLRRTVAADCAIGAGTVMSPAEVDWVRSAGADFVVMPHTDARVIRAAVAAGLDVAPGVATINEAFASLAAGARVLKLFPADEIGAAALAAWRAVLPGEVVVIAVGGVTPDNLAELTAAGASGFGVGSALYRPGLTSAEVAARAKAFMTAWREAYSSGASRSTSDQS